MEDTEEEKQDYKPRYRVDGREIVEWPKFGAYEFVNPYGLCAMKPKRPKTPEYDKPRQGCAILEPKVNEPYEAIPRRATRKELLKNQVRQRKVADHCESCWQTMSGRTLRPGRVQVWMQMPF